MNGTLGEPLFNGEFAVTDGRFEFYRTNFILADTQLAGRFEGDELSFEGRGTTSGGAVTLDGRFRWPEGVMNGSMRLKGDRLLVADTPEYRIVASPDLTVTANTNGYLVTGQVHIPSALIAPKDLTTSVRTSPDERVVGIDTEDDRLRRSSGSAARSTSSSATTCGSTATVSRRRSAAPSPCSPGRRTSRADRARSTSSSGEYKAFGQDIRISARAPLIRQHAAVAADTRSRRRAAHRGRGRDGGRQRPRPARPAFHHHHLYAGDVLQRGSLVSADRPLGGHAAVGRGAGAR